MSEDYEKIYQEFEDKEWCDGLPIVPPTEDRVSRMLEFTDRKPDDSLGNVPPSEYEATVESVAANAVMAGCKPEYFPVVVTQIETLLSMPNLRGAIATTGPVWPMSIVNGPIAKEIGLHSGWGLFGTGPNHRANLTIGRTMTLVIQNIGKSVPGISEKKPMWNLGRIGLCICENEVSSPWEPLHIEKGFKKETSTVTVYDSISLGRGIVGGGRHSGVFEIDSRKLAKRLVMIHYHPALGISIGSSFYFLSPASAKIYADNGWSKQDLKEFLYENCRTNIRQWYNEYPEQIREDIMRNVFAGLPSWMQVGDSIPLFPSPESIWIVVAGPANRPSSVWGELVARKRDHPVIIKPISTLDGTPIKSVYDFKRK